MNYKNASEIKNDIEKFLNKNLGRNMKSKKAHKIGTKTSKIFINDDLTKQEREIDAQIRKRVGEERSKSRKVRNGYHKTVY
ncbi:hypothetical protein RN001_010176 [Aquatica leii]|uniref:Uncharacterized protein n=1 Tax=Aquatica leii TaxID=1421715 RepID=A0AAN7Q312_9COLE|nr:hypothetical protein RN001_010176 [Aquatica leii]